MGWFARWIGKEDHVEIIEQLQTQNSTLQNVCNQLIDINQKLAALLDSSKKLDNIEQKVEAIKVLADVETQLKEATSILNQSMRKEIQLTSAHYEILQQLETVFSEASAEEIANKIGKERSYVSSLLNELAEANEVEKERKGHRVYYRKKLKNQIEKSSIMSLESNTKD